MRIVLAVLLAVALGLTWSCKGGPVTGPDGGALRCGGFSPTPMDCPDGSVCEQTQTTCADCQGTCFPK